MIPVRPRDLLESFDAFLLTRGLRLEAVVIGGAALNLLGFVSRVTKDCDILHPDLPPSIQEASRAFARERRAQGEEVQDDWLNNGPAQLAKQLPANWNHRLQPAFNGKALTLSALGRADLLKSKLFALCDRGLDLADCVSMKPTSEELAEAIPWLESQDANRDWPAHVRATLADVGRRLGHGI